MTLGELAATVPMTVIREARFESLGLLSDRRPGLLAGLYDPKARRECAANGDLAAVITTEALADSVPRHVGLAIADNPRERFFDAHSYLGSATEFYGPSTLSQISPDAGIDPAAHVSPAGVRIESGCILEPGAVLMPGTVLDSGVIVRAGAVLGAAGFHPVPYHGHVRNLPHYGGVRIGRDVEIQSNAVVCRAVFNAATTVGAGTGQNAVVSNQVRIGSGARVSVGAVVVRDVAPGATVTGYFALDHRRFLAAWTRLFR
jgi:UDP-3-O-[3-hydroxymyristoyl] glucosamine N-acyltransferase